MIDFLETGWCDVPQRQRSLRALFDYSWNLLSDREKENFAGLAVFRGNFHRSAAQAVGRMTIHEINSLVGKALLHPNREGRYEFNELQRQYAESRLRNGLACHRDFELHHSSYFVDELGRCAGEIYT
jgi:predicted ATPase